MYELDKIHLYPIYQVHQMSLKIYQKITLEKPIVMYFLAQFWCFKIFTLVRAGYLGEHFKDPNSQRFLYLFSFLTASVPSFQKIWVPVKSDCFAIIHFMFILKEQVIKTYSFVFSFQKPSLLFHFLCKAPFIVLKRTFPHSITLLFSIFLQLLDPSFYACFNT